jgi:low affinity Fe/Cu permease
MAAVALIIIWGITGPFFRWSDTWQLIINTGTTIITFLMVFLIQSTQNRDTQAIQLKLDELIRANAHARNRLLCPEDLTDDELQEVKANFAKLAERSPGDAEEVNAATRDLERAHQRVRKVAGRSGIT